jgi:hypothetical protein
MFCKTVDYILDQTFSLFDCSLLDYEYHSLIILCIIISYDFVEFFNLKLNLFLFKDFKYFNFSKALQ